jgi:hypothetical protein
MVPLKSAEPFVRVGLRFEVFPDIYQDSNIKSEIDDVSILHNVLFTL